jgi:hypothetical protein
VQDGFANLDSSQGLLLVGVHGALSKHTVEQYRLNFPDGLALAADGEEGAVIKVRGDPQAALFKATRHVGSGASLLTYGDGTHGTRLNWATIAGLQRRFAGGTAFLPFETGCTCAFFIMVPENGRFVPIIKVFPKPEKRESYEDYAERWVNFFGQQIHDYLTGDPARVTMRGAWLSMSSWAG